MKRELDLIWCVVLSGHWSHFKQTVHIV